jgi:hypothetical protein
MAITEIVSKQLAVLKADASQFKAEMKSAGAVEQKVMKDRLDGMEREIQTRERAGQKFGLYVAAAAAGWTIISKSVKTYEEHLKSMGSSGEAELKRLQGATGALTGSQKNLEIAIGKVASAGAGAAHALAQMVNELANIVSGVGGVVGAVGALDLAATGGLFGDAMGVAMKYGGPVNQGRALGSWVTSGVRNAIGNIRATGTEQMGEWNQVNSAANPDWVAQQIGTRNQQQSWSIATGKASGSQSLLGEDGTQAIQYIDQETSRLMKRALMGKAERYLKVVGRGLGLSESQVEPRKGGGGSGDGGSDLWGFDNWGRMGRESFDATFGHLPDAYADATAPWERTWSPGGIDAATRGKASDASRDLGEYMKELQAEQAKAAKDADRSGMEKIFGPLEEINGYASAFGLLKDAVTSAYDAWIDGSASATEAIRKSIAAGIQALGKDMLIRSLQEGAWAIADLAKGNFVGAKLHGLAAAGFAAGATAAGLAAKGFGDTGGGSAANARAAAGIGYGGSRSGGEQAGYSVTIVQGDGFSDSSPRYVARRTRRAMDLASRYAPYNGGQPG